MSRRLAIGIKIIFLFVFFSNPLLAQVPLNTNAKNNCNPPVPPFPIAYGELYMTGAPVQQTGIAGIPVPLTTFTNNGLSFGTTPNQILDIITIGTTGVYAISFTLSIEGAAGRDWTFQVARNGVPQPNIILIIGTLGTTTDSVSGATGGLLSLSAGDIISVLVSVTGAATTLVMEASNLHLNRIQ